MRYLTAGESHGKALVAIIEGFPSNVALDFDRIDRELMRRQSGFGRGGRMSIESDKAEFLSGVRGGITTGAPIAIIIYNKDHDNWAQAMDCRIGDFHARPLTKVRPGHADLPGMLKYNFTDARNILERASARETAIRTAAGAVAKELLYHLGIEVYGGVTGIGGVRIDPSLITKDNLVGMREFCVDAEAEERMKKAIAQAGAKGDTLGGSVCIKISGVPVGIGSHVQYDRKLDAILSGHLASIQAVKSVSFGMGEQFAIKKGSESHDKIAKNEQGFYHETNNAGGIEGGISNGEEIVINLTVKPIPTLMKGLKTVDVSTGEEAVAAAERSDICAVYAAGVVAENVAAFVIADEILKKTGGDSLEEILSKWQRS